MDSLAAVTSVANLPASCAGNHHEGYLADPAAVGVPVVVPVVVPTTVVRPGATDTARGLSTRTAVAERPAPGEFRIHDHRGGTCAPAEPSAAQAEVALAACEAPRRVTGSELLYARADLVADDAGRPLVMEFGADRAVPVPPRAPAATGRLADAVMAATGPAEARPPGTPT